MVEICAFGYIEREACGHVLGSMLQKKDRFLNALPFIPLPSPLELEKRIEKNRKELEKSRGEKTGPTNDDRHLQSPFRAEGQPKSRASLDTQQAHCC